MDFIKIHLVEDYEKNEISSKKHQKVLRHSKKILKCVFEQFSVNFQTLKKQEKNQFIISVYNGSEKNFHRV